MTVKKIIYFLGALCLLSCSIENEVVEVEKPENLIGKEKMILIMSDVMVLESHIQRELQRPEQYAIPMTNSIDTLLQKHGVNMGEYEVSFDYYGVQEEKLKGIYQAVFDTITNRINYLKMSTKKKNPMTKPK